MSLSRTPSPLVVLATFGSLGDLRPFILVATALQGRGHRVLLLAPAFHAEALATSGVPYRLYGTSFDSETVLAHPDLWHPRKGIGIVLGRVVPCIAEVGSMLADLAMVDPCVLVGHPLLLPVADIVRVRCPGLRVVGAWLAPLNLRTCDDPLTIGPLAIARWVPQSARRLLWRAIDRFAVDPMILPGLNELRAAVGLPPLRDFVSHLAAACDASLACSPTGSARIDRAGRKRSCMPTFRSATLGRATRYPTGWRHSWAPGPRRSSSPRGPACDRRSGSSPTPRKRCDA